MQRSKLTISTSRVLGILMLLSILAAVPATAARAAGKSGMAQLGVEVGNLAPEFSFQNAAGKWISLSDFRGKKVYLYSWATWCTCKEQLPELEKFHRAHKSPKFEVVAVASDSQGFKWAKQYLDKAGATFVALVDPNNELMKKYNFLATGNGFLIDEYGVVRMSAINFDIRLDKDRNNLLSIMKTDFKAVTATQKKNIEEQIKSLETDLAAAPKNLSKKLQLSDLYRRQGNLEKAEKLLRDAVAQKKTAAEAHYRLGVVLYQKGDVPAAVSEWERAFKYEPTNYIYMRNIEAYKDPEKFYAEIMKGN